MNNKHQTTLGISLGSRTLGYVVLQNEKLDDWGVKSFRTKWSYNKMNQITSIVHRIIQENGVHRVSIKVPRHYEKYESLSDLHFSLCLMLYTLSIPVYTSSINGLRLWYSIDGKRPKSTLEQYIASHYPVLLSRRNLTPSGKKYYLKLYEAVAAAEISLFLK